MKFKQLLYLVLYISLNTIGIWVFYKTLHSNLFGLIYIISSILLIINVYRNYEKDNKFIKCILFTYILFSIYIIYQPTISAIINLVGGNNV